MTYSHFCLIVGMVLLAPSMNRFIREALGFVYMFTAVGYSVWGSFK